MKNNISKIVILLLIILGIGLAIHYYYKYNQAIEIKDKEYSEYSSQVKKFSDSITYYKQRLEIYDNTISKLVVANKQLSYSVDSTKAKAEYNKLNYKKLTEQEIRDYLFKLTGDSSLLAVNVIIQELEYNRSLASIVPLQAKQIEIHNSIISYKDSTILQYKNIIVSQDRIKSIQDKYISKLANENKSLLKQNRNLKIQRVIITATSIILIILL